MSKERKLRKAAPAQSQKPLAVSDLLTPSQKLQDAARSKRVPLFLHKLRLCSVQLIWDTSTGDMARARDIKARLLQELCNFLTNKDIFADKATVVPAIIAMVSANIFRPLPPPVDEDELDEDDPTFDPRWPHLQLVYDVLLRLSISSDVDAHTLKRSITGTFVKQLLELFDSEDHRERDYLKTILHRIYAKCMPLRAFIRNAIHNVFYIYMYDTLSHNGVAELLEILGSIINGLALPVKLEHKKFLLNVLIPLHKMEAIANFHPQLAYCVSQFVDKDPTLAIPVINGLLRFWPRVDSQKELLFINELEELLEITAAEQFTAVTPALFKRIAQCVGSPHFQVAERALYIWQNDHVAENIANNAEEILQIMYPVLHSDEVPHWNTTVHSLSMDVLQQFREMCPQLTEQLTSHFDAFKIDQADGRQRREAAYAIIRTASAR